MSYKQFRPSISKYHSAIKWEVIHSLPKDIRHILDLSCGRGADIFRYIDTFKNLETLVGIDIDPTAIEEATRRIAESKTPIPENLKINLDVSDISNPETEKVIKKYMPRKKFDMIVCNFAVHYFFKEEESLNNFVKLVNTFSKKGTKVWIMCPDGEKLKELLVKHKMSIKNKYYELSSDEENISKVLGGKVDFRLVQTTYFKTAEHEKVIEDGTSHEYFAHLPTLMSKLTSFTILEQRHFDYWQDKVKHHLHFFEKEISFTNINIILEKH